MKSIAKILFRDVGAGLVCSAGAAAEAKLEFKVEEAAAVKLGSIFMLRGRGASISFSMPARTSSLRLGIAVLALTELDGPLSDIPSLDPGCPCTKACVCPFAGAGTTRLRRLMNAFFILDGRWWPWSL